jgi:23S rRNA pseudouridine2605 synthase
MQVLLFLLPGGERGKLCFDTRKFATARTVEPRRSRRKGSGQYRSHDETLQYFRSGPSPPMKPVHPRRVGLARALSKLGYCSRSQAFGLICAGRVKLNGTTQRNPECPVNLSKDQIEVDHQQVSNKGKIYLMLNKPRGLVTTASDEKGRQTVYSCLAQTPDSTLPHQRLPFVAPVGRLDKASEGLLLLTNDSEWSARILAPGTHLDKVYHVQVDRIVDAVLLKSLLKDVRAESGEFLRFKAADILRYGERNTWLEIGLDEGKNRHIRRLLEQFGIKVLRLVRVSIGSLKLGELPKGASRQLTSREKRALDRDMADATRRRA